MKSLIHAFLKHSSHKSGSRLLTTLGGAGLGAAAGFAPTPFLFPAPTIPESGRPIGPIASPLMGAALGALAGYNAPNIRRNILGDERSPEERDAEIEEEVNAYREMLKELDYDDEFIEEDTAEIEETLRASPYASSRILRSLIAGGAGAGLGGYGTLSHQLNHMEGPVNVPLVASGALLGGGVTAALDRLTQPT